MPPAKRKDSPRNFRNRRRQAKADDDFEEDEEATTIQISASLPSRSEKKRKKTKKNSPPKNAEDEVYTDTSPAETKQRDDTVVSSVLNPLISPRLQKFTNHVSQLELTAFSSNDDDCNNLEAAAAVSFENDKKKEAPEESDYGEDLEEDEVQDEDDDSNENGPGAFADDEESSDDDDNDDESVEKPLRAARSKSRSSTTNTTAGCRDDPKPLVDTDGSLVENVVSVERGQESYGQVQFDNDETAVDKKNDDDSSSATEKKQDDLKLPSSTADEKDLEANTTITVHLPPPKDGIDTTGNEPEAPSTKNNEETNGDSMETDEVVVDSKAANTPRSEDSEFGQGVWLKKSDSISLSQSQLKLAAEELVDSATAPPPSHQRGNEAVGLGTGSVSPEGNAGVLSEGNDLRPANDMLDVAAPLASDRDPNSSSIMSESNDQPSVLHSQNASANVQNETVVNARGADLDNFSGEANGAFHSVQSVQLEEASQFAHLPEVGTSSKLPVIRINAWKSKEYRAYVDCVREHQQEYKSAQSQEVRGKIVDLIFSRFSWRCNGKEYPVDKTKQLIEKNLIEMKTSTMQKQSKDLIAHKTKRAPVASSALNDGPRNRPKRAATLAMQQAHAAATEDASRNHLPRQSESSSETAYKEPSLDELLAQIPTSEKDNSGRPIVVSSGKRGSVKKHRGHTAYMKMMRENYTKFYAQPEERSSIYGLFKSRFAFRHGTFHGAPLSEQDIDSKITKAFQNERKNATEAPKAGAENAAGKASVVPKKRKKNASKGGSNQPRKKKASNQVSGGRFSTKAKRPATAAKAVDEEQVLEPLSEPEPLPTPPAASKVDWGKFDEKTRVLRVDFSNVDEMEILREDKVHFAKLLQRDDIALVSKGLVDPIESPHEFVNLVAAAFKDRPFHKFRRFERRVSGDGFVSYEEVDASATMSVRDYALYLRKLEEASDSNEGDFSFTYKDEDTKDHKIKDIRNTVFYMIDVDMPKNLNKFHAEFEESFKMKEILPGNEWCMMNSLPKSAQPFMGPNCYITPCGGYTKYHQDGHGTVDSGHTCLHGYNEVIMLRRLPEEHKVNACKLVPTLQQAESGHETTSEEAKSALYRLPHDDGSELTQLWATTKTVEEWNKMNYCASVFVLCPGEHLHINKGRLHAFRKLTFDPCRENDCHAALREAIKQKHAGSVKAPICISVAWDWMYLGLDARGIEEEVRSSIECADLCRNNNVESLAIPEASIIHTALDVVNNHERSPFMKKSRDKLARICLPTARDVATGVLPFLKKIADRDTEAIGDQASLESALLSVKKKPDSHCDELAVAVEPFGNDFFCKLCNKELSNSYFHCDGCENLLRKDFNICTACYKEERYKVNLNMHATDTTKRTDINHLGANNQNLAGVECSARQGSCKVCRKTHNGRDCGLCKHCSCKCHQRFTMHFRFLSRSGMEKLVEDCTTLANSVPKAATEDCTTLPNSVPKTATMLPPPAPLAPTPLHREVPRSVVRFAPGVVHYFDVEEVKKP